MTKRNEPKKEIKITEEMLKEKLSNAFFRRKYFEDNFYGFCKYYFREYFTFHTPKSFLEIYASLQEWKNLYFEGFRWCSKTTIAQMYVVWCIVYKKRRNIMWYSQTVENAEENLMYIANALIWDSEQWERIVNDFWNLYYPERVNKKWQKRIKKLDKFITENSCYVRAFSLWSSPRGKNYTAEDGKHRPDLFIFDDVDTINSCSSKSKIDRHFTFLLNEVLGWATTNTQILFLGNTIYEDGLVPRFREHIQNNEHWNIFRIPIYDKEWKIVWNRFVETDAEADELNKWIEDLSKKYVSLEAEKKQLGSVSFAQNYLLIPYVAAQHLITKDLIQYIDERDEELMYKSSSYFNKIQIGVDPAISTKEKSDRFAITVVGFRYDKTYVLEVVALEGRDKMVSNACSVVRSLYLKRHANKVVVESVAYQAVLKDLFSSLWLAVKEIKPHKDKLTRLMEKQALFEQGKIFFSRQCSKLIDELLAFPNWEHDDCVDSLVYWLDESNEPEVKIYFI